MSEIHLAWAKQKVPSISAVPEMDRQLGSRLPKLPGSLLRRVVPEPIGFLSKESPPDGIQDEQQSFSLHLQVAKMLTDYEWISSEKHLFGLENTAYDFKANNPKAAGQRLQKLQEMKEKLGRNVNMRAMNMLTQAEERVSWWFFLVERGCSLALKVKLSPQNRSIEVILKAMRFYELSQAKGVNGEEQGPKKLNLVGLRQIEGEINVVKIL
ncbi:unnamed protein product [Ranitomeya imitator]|uniref:Uncharacterized protein n=1 Tax=Ranitomeya imitator TaxID=111125 RepID=A0ABN9LR27_9NEOB|nr:unnamed protein product [Ranitomeya imitator]